jgi:putative FmdB family regulatory protein
MPIYQFYCDPCNNIDEEIFPSGKIEEVKCSKCGKVSRYIMSRTNVNMQEWKENLAKEVEYAKTPA